MKTATPAHSRWPGSTLISRLSSRTLSQSSSRPTMIVHTGPIDSMALPSASRRLSPRSTASATAMHCGRVNETVALMLIPRYVTSSIATIPALVAGILTIMFWARRLNAIAFSTIAAASRNRRGSVWMESRPSRAPFCDVLLQDGDRHHRVAGRTDRAVLDRVLELIDVSRVVPEARRRRLGHLMQRTLVRHLASGYHRVTTTFLRV